MPKKRGNNEGSPRYREDKKLWEARYSINGRQKSLYRKSQKEAITAMREVIAAHEKGEYVEPSRLTTAQWLNEWAELYGIPSWRDKSIETHLISIKKHLIPALGSITLQKISAEDIQRFINMQKEKGYTSSTIAKHISPLKTAMKQAIRSKKRSDNPFDAVKMPKLKQEETEHLTEDEQHLYSSALPNSTVGRLLRFVLGTGIRIGEAIGLQWSDIGEESFTINRTVGIVTDQTAGEGEKRTKMTDDMPKSEKSVRTIPLSAPLKELFRLQQTAQRLERLKAGSRWKGKKPCEGETWIFASKVGTALENRNIRRVHDATIIKAGVKRITIHGLRHSFATRWIANSLDVRSLSEVLGHADVATTMRKYVHSTMERKAEAMQTMSKVF